MTPSVALARPSFRLLILRCEMLHGGWSYALWVSEGSWFGRIYS